MSPHHIAVCKAGPVAWITINRPEVHNAIDSSMWLSLREVLVELDRDPQVAAAVLRGAGDKAFSAGSDIAEFARMSNDQVRRCFYEMEVTISTVERLEMPVVACVNGYALGSALELMLACDVQIASQTARFGMPIARLGIMPAPEFTGRLVRVMGPSLTRDLLYSGRLMRAPEALGAGLIARAVAPGKLVNETESFLQQLLTGSPSSIRAAKKSVKTIVDQWLPEPDAVTGSESYYIDENDFREGVRAFLEKRPPQFRARSARD